MPVQHKIRLLLFTFALISIPVFSQYNLRFFKQSPYDQAFISDIRSTHTKLEIGFVGSLGNHYYIENYSKRPFNEIHLGENIPIAQFEYRNENYSVQTFLSFPLGWILLIDMYEPTTAPVINNDYWFGTQVKTVFKSASFPSFIKNISLNWKPFYHESTHIGDEFSIHGMNTFDDFQRINISYEASEISLSLNEADTSLQNFYSLKIGMQALLPHKNSYYASDSLEVSGQEIVPSQSRFEFFVQLNTKRVNGFACSKKWHQIFSLELRNREKFAYTLEEESFKTWNIQGYLGWKYHANNYKNVGLYLKYYHGINPHGQFRNTENYKFIGLSVVLSH